MSAAKIPIFGKIQAGVVYQDRPGAYAFIFNDQRELAVVRTPIGAFLPGGGVEAGESDEQALARELREEMAWELLSARFLRQAVQYHWSEFYQRHFKKIGSFYLVEARPLLGGIGHPDHTLYWMKPQQAARKLTQEFQRWAVREGAGG